MASLHYHHALVAKVFTSWKHWLCSCREVRSREQMRQQQQHKMDTLLARVTSVCQHDSSTVEKVCQGDPPTSGKECWNDSPALEKACHSAVSSSVVKECHHDPTTLGKDCHSEQHHNPIALSKNCHSRSQRDSTALKKKSMSHPPAVRKEDTIGLITSKLVRQELVSIV